jgi:XTP/dITP diphosphohydrolase
MVNRRFRVVLATENSGKLREFQALLGAVWDLVPQSSLGVAAADETGESFLENALIKARHAAAMTGFPAVADDSGLEVDALGGAPGIHSARYAGRDATDGANNDKLLTAMEGISTLHRTARFRCVLAYVDAADDPDPLLAEGVWEGLIGLVPQGTNGFGYDSLFVDGESGQTSAQLAPIVKNERSHRGRALRELIRLLELSSSRTVLG